jgi:single-stranded DNA-binding protein
MAELSVSGYVNRPEAVTSKGGRAYSKFTLASKQKNGKNSDGSEKPATKVYYNVVDFVNSSPPEDGSYVTVKGWFRVQEYTNKEGVPGKSFEINAQELTVAPPFAGSGKPSVAKAKAASVDPWDV